VFLIKKIIGSMLLPLPTCLLIAFVGLFLVWRGRREMTGKILITLGLISLTAASYLTVFRVIDDPLKDSFEAYMPNGASALDPAAPREVNYVVVLAEGHMAKLSIPVTGWLICPSLLRLMEGVRIFRQHSESRLILSGWRPLILFPRPMSWRVWPAFSGWTGMTSSWKPVPMIQRIKPG